ncbi:MAG: anti-sigma F factor [Eubacterium sp.]|nr:anti-sigma F factor [Eubacterium sp.]
MNTLNEFRLTIESKSVNEAFSRAVVSVFIAPLDPTIEEVSDLKTAVSEAVTNSIVHGYKDTNGKIYIEGTYNEKSIVKIRIKDKGSGIENVNLAMQPLYSTGEGDRAGLGFTVMQSFCDRVNVTSKVNKGTTVTLVKRIAGRSKW